MTPPRNDSTLARSRREALIIMAAYAVAMTWTAVVCYVLGYERDPADITRPFGLGIPDWVLWGIFAPWMVCNLFTAWFTLFYMEDEQLAEEDEEVLADDGDDNGGPTAQGADSSAASSGVTEDRITERPRADHRIAEKRFTEDRFTKDGATEDRHV